MKEKNYDFRRFLDEVHQSGLRDKTLQPNADETDISCGWSICIPEDAGRFLQRTAQDLVDYLWTGMECGICMARGNAEKSRCIRLSLASDLKVKRSFRLTCTEDAISIEGADERGIAMGCYYLEDVMTMREAPFIPHAENLVKEPLFSPRMIHSAYGMDVFTENYLRRIAHAGFDTIVTYIREDMLHGSQGPFDFAPLIDMAEDAGLDVYLYSDIKNIYHPSDKEAEAFYEARYGGLFQRYPKAKGLVLVGESCQFPSHDSNTTGSITGSGECCFRAGKPAPGWWPCEDFPEFVSLLQKSIWKYSPGADLIFWTYNWGFAPEKLRTKLVKNLPEGVSVEVNYEMHDNVKIWGTQERALDYTLSLTGPSKVFLSEADAAKQSGHRLYAMCNTGGRTWDHGTAPYLPAVQQWGKRMMNLLEDRKRFGLCGLMETHHYGWYPSVISEISKWLFWSNGPDQQTVIRNLAVRDFSEQTADEIVKIWNDWSVAVSRFITPIEDQYGPCRVGPAYPFLFSGVSLRQTFGMPMKFPWTVFNQADIAFPVYTVVNDPDGLDMGIRRIQAEIKHLPDVIALWRNGADRMEEIVKSIPPRKQEKAGKMAGLGHYIANTLTTAWNIKRWWLENNRLLLEEDPQKAEEILLCIIQIAKEEIANAEDTIPLVEADSALGYEPSMDYTADRPHLEWKIRQLQSVLDLEIPKYRAGIRIAESMGQKGEK